MSGNCVAEWFPQMGTRRTGVLRNAERLRQLGTSAVLIEPGQGGEPLGGTPSAAADAIRALVLAGLPTTVTRTPDAAFAAMAAP